MSTKISLAHGKNFHLFHDGMDENNEYIYLQITSCNECHNTKTIAVPVDVWETIRQIPGIKFDLINKTHDDIVNMVTAQVNERMNEYNAATRSDEKNLINFCGSALFGNCSLSIHQQIKNGLDYYQEQREFQCKVKDKMKEHNIVIKTNDT